MVTPDGKVVLGCIVTGATDDLGLVRFDDKGSLDASFGSGGSVVLERPGDQQLIAGAMLYDPQGRVVVVSESHEAKVERWIERFWL